MFCAQDIEDNILVFNVINSRLGDIRDEMLHLNTMPFGYDYNRVQEQLTMKPGNKEFLRVERMIDSIQSFIKCTVSRLIQEKKDTLALETVAI